MNYTIYRNTTVIATVRPDSGSTLSRQIMGENVVKMTFSLPAFTDFLIGDTTTVYGNLYTLNKLPDVAKISSLEYQYTLEFQAQSYDLAKIQCLFLNPVNSLSEADFSLMGNASDFCNLVLANANRVSSGWTLGTVDVTEYKNLTFSSENCLQVLSRLAEEFKTEFWIEGKVISLAKKQVASGYSFEYGQGKGLYQLDRSNTSDNVITRLYAFGSTKNLPANYRNYSDRLLMPVATGAYLEANVSQYGIIEATQIFEDIFPNRTGTVSAVGTHLEITDSLIDFDINLQLIPGTTAKITFNTGQLAGYTFEISNYNNSTKRITFNVNKEEKAILVPTTLLKAAIGDKYVLTDIIMPDTYKAAAEVEVQVAAQAYLNENKDPKVKYGLTLDPIDAKRKNITLTLGNTVQVIDTPMAIDKNIRVVSLTRKLDNAFDYAIELSETVSISSIVRQISAQENIEKAIKINRLLDPQRARLNWRNQQELLNMAFDPEGDFYTDKVKPLIVETTALAVGAKSQQLTLDAIVFQPNYTANPAQIRVSAGALTHFTVDPAGVKEWTLSSYANDALIAGTAYYIYAKCLKAGTTGAFLLTTAKITVESDPLYYHFLVGNLHSVQSGVRAISLTFGQTNINGKFISTGRITSQDGLTWFDLDSGTIAGKVTFGAGSTGYNNLTDKPDLALYANKVLTDQAIADLQTQVDGSISSWFYDPNPTLLNIPASDWTTDLIKDEHIGDTYYSITNQTAYRFLKISGSYQWQLISDTVATAALAAANQAQDTADGKRRIFIAQPITPYEIGDLWAQGSGGDLMRCSVTRLTGSYNAADWVKASKYTDDTAVNNLQIGGRNLLLNSSFKNGLAGYNINAGGVVVIETVDGRLAAKITSNSIYQGLISSINYPSKITANTYYTISFWIRGVVYDSVTLNIGFDQIASLVQVPNTDVWTKVSYTVYSGSFAGPTQFVCVGVGGNQSFFISDIKIEIGNKATDWSPGPEDVAADATDKAEASKQYADAKDALLKVQQEAYADGVVTAEEQARINQAQANLQTALNAVNGIIIGGRNLIRNSKGDKSELWAFADIAVLEGNPNLHIVSSTIGQPMAFSQDVYLDAGVYSLSFFNTGWQCSNELYVLGDGSFANVIHFQSLASTGSSEFYSSTFTVTIAGMHSFRWYCTRLNANFVGQVWSREIKLEKGNKATDWTPAPEDVDSKIDASLVLAQTYAANQAATAQANAISIAAGDAQTKADTAYSTALSAANTYALTVANSASSTAQVNAAADALTQANTAYNNAVAAATNQYNALTGALKAMAYQDVVELSKLGTTVINNGMIKTTLLDADYIRANIINAGYITALGLTSNQIQTASTGRRITIKNDNTLKFYGAAGNLAIEMLEENGVCKLVFYDTAGNKTYEAGQSGIVYVTNIPESWSLSALRLVSTNVSSTADSLTQQIESSLSCYKTVADYEGGRAIGTNASVNAYYYNAGQNVNAEANRQYEGYKTTSGTYTNIGNGWYTRANQLFYADNAPEGIYTLDFFYINNGVIGSSLRKSMVHLYSPGSACLF